MRHIRFVCLTLALVSSSALSAQSFRGPWSGTSSYGVGDTVTYLGNTYVDIVATAPVTTTGPINLFNQSTVNLNTAVNSDTGALASFGGDFESTDYIPVPSGGTFVTNITINYFGGTPNYGLAFYDSGHSYVSGLSNPSGGFLAVASATPISVPSSASYVRFWYERSTEGSGITDANAIVDAGSTLQSTYTSYGSGGTTTTPSAAPTDTTHWALTAGNAPLPFAGKKMFCLGDSILYLSGNPPGAACGNIATKIGATLSSQGDTVPGVDAVFGRAFDGFQNGPNHPLSAAILADVDLLVIMLGTNQDSTVGIGSPTDNPGQDASTYSMSAQMRYMLETILGWNSSRSVPMRIVFVGPYQSSRFNNATGPGDIGEPFNTTTGIANAISLTVLKNINTEMKAVCDLYAIPYIDMYDTSGVNFSTASRFLNSDGLHPTGTGYSTFFVPTIANALVRYAYQ